MQVHLLPLLFTTSLINSFIPIPPNFQLFVGCFVPPYIFIIPHPILFCQLFKPYSSFDNFRHREVKRKTDSTSFDIGNFYNRVLLTDIKNRRICTRRPLNEPILNLLRILPDCLVFSNHSINKIWIPTIMNTDLIFFNPISMAWFKWVKEVL